MNALTTGTFCTALSLRNMDNWHISYLTVHVVEWATIALTFCGDNITFIEIRSLYCITF